MVAIDALSVCKDAVSDKKGTEEQVIQVDDGIGENGAVAEIPRDNTTYYTELFQRMTSISVMCSLVGASMAFAVSLGAYPIGPNGVVNSPSTDYFEPGAGALVSALVTQLICNILLCVTSTVWLCLPGNTASNRYTPLLLADYILIFFGYVMPAIINFDVWAAAPTTVTLNYLIVLAPVLITAMIKMYCCIQLEHSMAETLVGRDLSFSMSYYRFTQIAMLLCLSHACVEVSASSLRIGAVRAGCVGECPRVMAPADAFYPLFASLCFAVYAAAVIAATFKFALLKACLGAASLVCLVASGIISRRSMSRAGLETPRPLQGMWLPLHAFLPAIGLTVCSFIQYLGEQRPDAKSQSPTLASPTPFLSPRCWWPSVMEVTLLERTKWLSVVQIVLGLGAAWWWRLLGAGDTVTFSGVETAVVWLCCAVWGSACAEVLAEARGGRYGVPAKAQGRRCETHVAGVVRLAEIAVAVLCFALSVLWRTPLLCSVWGAAARLLCVLQVLRILLLPTDAWHRRGAPEKTARPLSQAQAVV